MATTRTLEDLSAKERERALAIRDWFQREPGWTDRILGGDATRTRDVLDGLFGSRRGKALLERATDRILSGLDSRLLDDLGPGVVLRGADADASERGRVLQRADDSAQRAARGYVGWLSGQGAVAGAASLSLPLAAVAVTADVASAVLGALRATAHMLVVYGVPAGQPGTVHAAVDLAGVATETDPVTRQRAISSALTRLVEGGGDGELDADRFPRLVAQQMGSRAVREVVEQTIRRAVRRRAVRVVPLFGAAASGLASGWLARRVTEAGRHVGAAYFLHAHAGVRPEQLLGTAVVPEA